MEDIYKLLYVSKGGAAQLHGMHSVADTTPKSCKSCIPVCDSDERKYPSDQRRGGEVNLILWGHDKLLSLHAYLQIIASQHSSSCGLPITNKPMRLLVMTNEAVLSGERPEASGSCLMVVCRVCIEGGEQAQEDSGAQTGEVPEFDADWGLETLVNVGEHWIDSLLQVLPKPF